MGYDMYSKLEAGDDGYFRLNIWGMAEMRSVILQGDPGLERTVRLKMTSNDGRVVTKNEGKRIAAACRKWLKDNPVGSVPLAKKGAITDFETQVAAMFGGLTKTADNEPVSKEWAETIEEFAVYNETKAPYEVC